MTLNVYLKVRRDMTPYDKGTVASHSGNGQQDSLDDL